jgi:hypothetical protein
LLILSALGAFLILSVPLTLVIVVFLLCGIFVFLVPASLVNFLIRESPVKFPILSVLRTLVILSVLRRLVIVVFLLCEIFVYEIAGCEILKCVFLQRVILQCGLHLYLIQETRSRARADCNNGEPSPASGEREPERYRVRMWTSDKYTHRPSPSNGGGRTFGRVPSLSWCTGGDRPVIWARGLRSP